MTRPDLHPVRGLALASALLLLLLAGCQYLGTNWDQKQAELAGKRVELSYLESRVRDLTAVLDAKRVDLDSEMRVLNQLGRRDAAAARTYSNRLQRLRELRSEASKLRIQVIQKNGELVNLVNASGSAYGRSSSADASRRAALEKEIASLERSNQALAEAIDEEIEASREESKGDLRRMIEQGR